MKNLINIMPIYGQEWLQHFGLFFGITCACLLFRHGNPPSFNFEMNSNLVLVQLGAKSNETTWTFFSSSPGNRLFPFNKEGHDLSSDIVLWRSC